MKTVAKIAGGVALVAGIVATGGALLAPASATLLGIGTAATFSSIALGAGIVSSLAGSLAGSKKAEMTAATTDRLTLSIDPDTPRKIVFGATAMATDVRDQEYTDSDTYLHRFVVVASHKVAAIDEIWFDNEKAWTSAGGAQGKFAGYLTVATRLEGSAANAINISSRMGSARRFTGLAYVHLRYKLTGNSKKAESPFSQAIPSRVTIRGKGAYVYDPRLDSTVPGGSGSQRADDQTTWAYDPGGAGSGRNPALQLLWYLLGWRIQNPVTSEWKLAVGKGIPPERIDMESFITAANLCDESVSLAAGGTEKRYRSDGMFSEADDPGRVIGALEAAMNGRLRDHGGKLSLKLFVNDLATPVADFDDSDVIGEFEWTENPGVDETFNAVRGRWIDPSDKALYQPVDYPAVRIDSPDGIERIDPFDLPTVQSASQAQRLAKQHLQRNLYRRTFAAEFQATAWKVQKDDVVRLTFSPLGFVDKLFRVVENTVRIDGVVPMLLREEHADLYAWDEEESPAVQPADPSVFDPANAPLLQAIDELDDLVAQAQADADAAQQDVDDALDAIDELAADSLLTRLERRKVNEYMARLSEARTKIRASASAVGIAASAAMTAEAAAWSGASGLKTYTDTLNPPLGSTSATSTPIAYATYKARADAYEAAIADLQKAIDGQVYVLAQAAQAAADAAQTDADAGLSRLDDLDNDGKLTKAERRELNLWVNRMVERRNRLRESASAIGGLTTELAAEASAWSGASGLKTYFDTLNPPLSSTSATPTPISTSTRDTRGTAWESALHALVKATEQRAALLADWDGISNTPGDLNSRELIAASHRIWTESYYAKKADGTPNLWVSGVFSSAGPENTGVKNPLVPSLDAYKLVTVGSTSADGFVTIGDASLPGSYSWPVEAGVTYLVYVNVQLELISNVRYRTRVVVDTDGDGAGNDDYNAEWAGNGAIEEVFEFTPLAGGLAHLSLHINESTAALLPAGVDFWLYGFSMRRKTGDLTTMAPPEVSEFFRAALLSSVEEFADKTTNHAPTMSPTSAVIEIARDEDKAVKPGELPKSVQFTRKKGNSDVSASATWARTNPSAGYSSSFNSSGLFTLTAVDGVPRDVPISSDYEGVLIPGVVQVKFKDDPPSTSGADVDEDTSLQNPSTTSFVQLSDWLLVVPPDTDVALSANATHAISSGTGQLELKWQYSPDMTSPADVGAVATGGALTVGEAQFLTCSRTKTGLTAGEPAYFRLMGRNASANNTINISNGRARAAA